MKDIILWKQKIWRDSMKHMHQALFTKFKREAAWENLNNAKMLYRQIIECKNIFS